jgi:hypothetical protein
MTDDAIESGGERSRRAKPTFAIEVPSTWGEQSRDGEWVFDGGGSDQLVVQTLTAPREIAREQREPALDELFVARHQSLEAVSHETGTLLPAGFEHGERSSSLSFVGGDPHNRVLLYGRIVVGRRAIVIATYYRYDAGGPITRFVAAAQPVCASLVALDA